jgi:hypothetical protein
MDREEGAPRGALLDEARPFRAPRRTPSSRRTRLRRLRRPRPRAPATSGSQMVRFDTTWFTTERGARAARAQLCEACRRHSRRGRLTVLPLCPGARGQPLELGDRIHIGQAFKRELDDGGVELGERIRGARARRRQAVVRGPTARSADRPRVAGQSVEQRRRGTPRRARATRPRPRAERRPEGKRRPRCGRTANPRRRRRSAPSRRCRRPAPRTAVAVCPPFRPRFARRTTGGFAIPARRAS